MGFEELIQIVDEDNQPVGSATRTEVHAKGLWHRIVRIMVEDGRGHVLLQLRGPAMKTFPNCWDHSAAGHIDEGETYEEAGRRELAEETGIVANKLEEMDSYKSQRVEGTRKLNRFNKVYQVIIDPATPIKLQASEVAELRWFTIDDAKKLVTEHPHQVTEGLTRVLAEHY